MVADASDPGPAKTGRAARRVASLAGVALLLGSLAASAVMSQPRGAPLQGGVESGDVFNSNGEPDQDSEDGGVAGEPAIGRYGRDAQCGGTNRVYYDRMYGVAGVVLSEEEAQEDYRRGEVIRCGSCGESQMICWLNEEATGQGGGQGRGRLLHGGTRENNSTGDENGYPDPVMVGPPRNPRLHGGTQSGGKPPQQVQRPPRQNLRGVTSGGRHRGKPVLNSPPPPPPAVYTVNVTLGGFPVSVKIPADLPAGVPYVAALKLAPGSASPWVTARIVVDIRKAPGRRGLVRFLGVSRGGDSPYTPLNLPVAF